MATVIGAVGRVPLDILVEGVVRQTGKFYPSSLDFRPEVLKVKWLDAIATVRTIFRIDEPPAKLPTPDGSSMSQGTKWLAIGGVWSSLAAFVSVLTYGGLDPTSTADLVILGLLALVGAWASNHHVWDIDEMRKRGITHAGWSSEGKFGVVDAVKDTALGDRALRHERVIVMPPRAKAYGGFLNHYLAGLQLKHPEQTDLFTKLRKFNNRLERSIGFFEDLLLAALGGIR